MEEKNRLDTFCTECHLAVENAKLTYLENLGNKVNATSTSTVLLEDYKSSDEQMRSS